MKATLPDVDPRTLLLGEMTAVGTEIWNRYEVAVANFNKGDLSFSDFMASLERYEAGLRSMGELQEFMKTGASYHQGIDFINNQIVEAMRQKSSMDNQYYGGRIDYPMMVLTCHDNPLSNYISRYKKPQV